MGRLYTSTRPAERARGCLVSLRPKSHISVVRDGGAAPSGVSYDSHGVVLTGSNYLVFQTDGPELLSPDVSIRFVFWPVFDAGDGASHQLFDADTDGAGTGRFGVLKRGGGGSNELRVILGGTTIADIPLAAYESAWITGQRNVLAIRGTSGATSAELNGSPILVADPTAWSPSRVRYIYLGSAFIGNGSFNGTIEGFDVFSDELSASELAYASGAERWGWRDRALIDLPMTLADYDPAGNMTRNRGRLGAAGDAALGAGAARPTKLDGRGFGFAGAIDHLTSATGGVPVSTGDFAVAALLRFSDYNIVSYWGYLSGGSSPLALSLAGSGTILLAQCGAGGQVLYTAPVDYWRQRHSVVVSRIAGELLLYVDGRLRDVDTSSADDIGTPTQMRVGANESGAVGLIGEVQHAALWVGEGLVGLQAADYDARMRRRGGRR